MPSTLIDQLPVLVDMLRYLEELTIMQVPNDPSLVRRGLAVEEVNFSNYNKAVAGYAGFHNKKCEL
jgi:hypothetical protein